MKKRLSAGFTAQLGPCRFRAWWSMGYGRLPRGDFG